MTKPKSYSGIMVSSTFSDLEEHRRDLIRSIENFRFFPNVMENSGAQSDKDVIDTSLKMVRDSAAYIGVVSHRYGQIVECEARNPRGVSLTELEFDEAMRLGRPILIFIMGDKHPITLADVETDAAQIEKLNRFRERAKKMREDSDVERIYETFESKEDFATRAAIAVGKLSESLKAEIGSTEASEEFASPKANIETTLAPDLRAIPHYLGSHDFVGRKDELKTLNDWCGEADRYPVLLFEAIGGSGKSMVTWNWLTQHAERSRGDWAGRFWFSFYEGGATMTKFCREALAYMTGTPIEDLRKMRMNELAPQLIAQLDARPWLLVLDGLERILVAYHRIDAAQMRDEDVDNAEDIISSRDPRAVIDPNDRELLLKLTAVRQSKILITSRLTPQVFFNRGGTPRPGVRREILRGLRPEDAEALFRSQGIEGDSRAIRNYLQSNCDCHPLVIGALAGLVNHYMPDRGNFDAWVADPTAGGSLELGELDLIQSRNHILDAAIAALPEAGRKLLQTLSWLQAGADYETLKAFNPHLPPPPNSVEEPTNPKDRFFWGSLDDDEKNKAKKRFKVSKKKYDNYLNDYSVWEQSAAVKASVGLFDETLQDLEKRGLLQYEDGLKKYDLHPVVRGVAYGRIDEDIASDIGSRVVDHFSSRPHDPWEQAESLDDLSDGIQIVSTLTRLSRFEEAWDVFSPDLHFALVFNFIAHQEILRLIKPFFPMGWTGETTLENENAKSALIAAAANSFENIDTSNARKLSQRGVALNIMNDRAEEVFPHLTNLSINYDLDRKKAVYDRLVGIISNLSEAIGDNRITFTTLLFKYHSLYSRGDHIDADKCWEKLEGLERPQLRVYYRSGAAELLRAEDLLRRGDLSEAFINHTEKLCSAQPNLIQQIQCLVLRGEYHLFDGEPSLAIEPLKKALQLIRKSGRNSSRYEGLLILAKLLTGNRIDAREVAEKLEEDESGAGLALVVAKIWKELGDTDRTKKAALKAHKLACADGEPHVYRYNLDQAGAILRELGETPPEVPQYDPSTREVFDWEEDLKALIEKTRQERKAQEAKAEKE